MSSDFTAIVSGAGPAGLAAAILLAQDGVNTAVIAPGIADDARTTALMQPAVQLLKFVGVWTGELQAQCAPLKRLHILDDVGNLIAAPPIEFTADELGLAEFGFNVPLAALIPALHVRAKACGVHFIIGSSLRAQLHDANIQVELADGAVFTSRVLLVADGAKSTLRASLGFKTEERHFAQMALATSFSHTAQHEFTSTEWHKPDGAFTTVPLPGNRSSLVWMGKPARVEGLLAMDDRTLATEIQLGTHGTLGRISDLGPRKAFAMTSQRATCFAKQRAILIGEAAHSLPPIGAQGLNLSLRDAATAADLIIGAQDPGAESICATYDKQRRSDVIPRQEMTGLLNLSLLSGFEGAHIVRAVGLAAVAKIPTLRQLAMRQGLYPSAPLPFAMRANT